MFNDKNAKSVRYDDVYITPGYIKFDEAFEGITYQRHITIKNVGIKPAFIKIHQPTSMVFKYLI